MTPKKDPQEPPSRVVQALLAAVTSSALIPYREELNGARDTDKLERHVDIINAVYKVIGHRALWNFCIPLDPSPITTL